ncbi:fimbrillin family protein [Bacteroides ovatus]|uniref:fimbrillin family protein n=1 Tax=Bacteroides ovatus TaxID=28116 RepID=UPI00216572DA|nr:fimbrillin family protein [Bacteroides ovatus]MCS2930663.1 fimbrillin family protein [Bacteroides ovatus]
MKRSFFVLGVAVAALASCTSEEVVDMPQSRAIQFGTFVNHSTRSNVTETTDKNLTKFFVFGNYDDAWTPVYTNVRVNGGQVGDQSVWTPTQAAYWETGKTYRFGAYCDGENQNTAVSFKADEQKMTFENYAVNDSKDLIVAIPADITAQESENGPVNLSFYHMLSQVKFTFNNSDSHDYKMKISDIKVKAVKTATGTATYKAEKPSIVWETQSASQEEYNFGTLEDIAENFAENTHTTTCFVIPQNNDMLQVTFTATFYDASDKQIASSTFKGDLNYQGDTEGTNAGEWTPGFKYNYTVEINGSVVNPDLEEQIIEFTVQAVEGWKDAANTDIENPEITE